jgi:hypothetical protein
MAAPDPGVYADAHADALEQLGAVDFHRRRWRECAEWSQQSVNIREAAHGRDHELAANALSFLAGAQHFLGSAAAGRASQLRVLAIRKRVNGPLSQEAGMACVNIGDFSCI